MAENKMSAQSIRARQEKAIDKAARMLEPIISKYSITNKDIESLSGLTYEMYELGCNDMLEEMESKFLNHDTR